MAEQVPRFAPDCVSSKELAALWAAARSHNFEGYDTLNKQTDYADSWVSEAEKLIERANAGDEDAQWVIGLVTAQRLTR